MDYEQTISEMSGRKVFSLWHILSIKIWRFRILLTSPLSLTVKKKKTFFKDCNIFTITHHWEKPYIRYYDGKYWKSLNVGYLYLAYLKPIKSFRGDCNV